MLADQPGRGRPDGEDQVEFVAHQTIAEGGRGVHDKPHLNIRIRLAEDRQRVGQQVQGGRVDKADPEFPDLAVVMRLDPGLQVAGAPQHLRGEVRHRPTRLRQSPAPPVLFEQDHAEPLLELREALRESRLADPELLGSLGEGGQLGHLVQVGEGAGADVHGHLGVSGTVMAAIAGVSPLAVRDHDHDPIGVYLSMQLQGSKNLIYWCLDIRT